MASNTKRRAERGTWKTESFTEGMTKFLSPINRRITKNEVDTLTMGLIPQQMEDKWFIYYENGFIYFHRSWTGSLIYKVGLEIDGLGEGILTTIEVSNNAEEYSGNNRSSDDEKMMLFSLLGIFFQIKLR